MPDISDIPYTNKLILPGLAEKSSGRAAALASIAFLYKNALVRGYP